MTETPDDLTTIEQQLGRVPHGFQEVMRRNAEGLPAIIRVASLVNATPFPTLFWMSDVELSQQVYQHESKGTTRQIQDLIDGSSELQARMKQDNLDHIQLRESYYSEAIRTQIAELNLEDSFAQKGIGGNSNFSRVRCLHAYLAAHLVKHNVVGELINEVLEKQDPLRIALDQMV